MDYIYQKGLEGHPLYLLFHGTGGNEYDLLGLMAMIHQEGNILSFRGDVNEHGLLRFFKRLRPGVFDEEDLIQRTSAYQEDLKEILNTHQKNEPLYSLGYSNGANFIGSLLYHNEKRMNACVLLHPMVPYSKIKPKDLNGVHVFIGAGKNDPICPYNEALQLKEDLENAGAKVFLHTTSQGHQITEDEILAAKAWLESLQK